ncbi:hypothetical protein LXL04_005411 [Taraxacum kok-saghyz]
MHKRPMSWCTCCWEPIFGRDHKETTSVGVKNVGDFGKDGLLWFHDIGKHGYGEYSMAIIQANQVLEDQSQIESGPFGTYVGVYDGHGGPDCARYVCDNLFKHFQANLDRGEGNVTPEKIKRAFLETENKFTDLVSEMWDTRTNIATCGSCCLVGVVCHQTLFVANLGDARAVLGRKSGNGIIAIQLSTEHNANLESVRRELRDLHPHDDEIVVMKHGVWRVKGIIQVSRSIGDVYMKHARFNKEPIAAKFRLPEPMVMPIMSATPTILCHPIEATDSFLIFASDGLWEHLTNEEAVDIVHRSPRAGIAKRLVKAALQEAAKKREMRYSDLRKIDKRVRRHFHDDITVIVLFLNYDLITNGPPNGTKVSLRSALEH